MEFSDQNKHFEETYNQYIKPKPVFTKKVAGSDGKSQYSFLQLAAAKEQIIESQLKYYTLEEVSKHNSEKDIWMVINGIIYDVSVYKSYHPGGLEKIMMGAGKDATSLISILKILLDNIFFV